MPFDTQACINSWQSFREMNQTAWAKQTLRHAAAHLMNEYEPATSTLGHSHYCYSGDLAAVALLNKLAESL